MPEAMPRQFALLPAAGHSRRMGQPKLAMLFGEQTVLERVLSTLRQANIDKTLLVLGPHVAFLKPLAHAIGADVLLLPEATPDMRSTIQRGLDGIESRWSPQSTDRWLLLPPDHPTLDAAVITALIEALDAAPAATIAVPVHEGERGHPALISWSHVSGMRAFPPDQGLNTYLRRFRHETIEVPWPTADVVRDLDTPQDYERLRRPVANDLLGGEP